MNATVLPQCWGKGWSWDKEPVWRCLDFLPLLPLGRIEGVMEVNHTSKKASTHPAELSIWHILTTPSGRASAARLACWDSSTCKVGSRATGILSFLAACWFRQLPGFLESWTVSVLSEQKATALGHDWIFLTPNILWPFHRGTRESSILRELVHPDRCEGLLDKGVTDLTGINCDHSPNCHLDVRFDLKLRLEGLSILCKILK